MVVCLHCSGGVCSGASTSSCFSIVSPCFQQLRGEPSRVLAIAVFEVLHCLVQLLVGEGWKALSKSPCCFFLGVGGAVGRR
eukprot:8983400-Pyramimonas_sp.AAC.1